MLQSSDGEFANLMVSSRGSDPVAVNPGGYAADGKVSWQASQAAT
jgi:hypothetical protein